MTDETTAESALESKADSQDKPNRFVLAGKVRAANVDMKELGRLGGKAPHAKRGHKPRKPTKCYRCGAKCESARLAWNHCKGKPRKSKYDGPFVPRENVRPRGRPKGSGLGHYTKKADRLKGPADEIAQ